MTQTIIPFGDPKAQKKWSSNLAVDVLHKAYFSRKFVGVGDNNIIEQKTELESDKGDRVSFDLSVQLRGRPVQGDNRAKGTEENLRFFTDEVIIDQTRHPVSAGGKMTRKRTAHDMRKIARNRLGDYWAKYLDELMFIYLSGARGMNQDYIEPEDFEGHASNPIQAPDADHQLYGGTASSKQTITTNDKMSREIIEVASTNARMMRAQNPDTANMVPVVIDGEEHYVMVMTPFQEHDLRNAVSANGGSWFEIQKAAAAAEGAKNKIFKGGLGMINNVVLHSHESVIRFDDYGAGGDLPAARALFMGRQAGVIAYGTPKGSRFSWKEELEDYDNEPTVVGGTIVGMKKARFNGKDFGVSAVDTYAKDPKAA
ncbi:N4-gp56 family major capsid protein [Rhodovulum sp. BSW8]|uniref:N4-gp56 family major capsid protein n=1 Tax=Rhodovulum sp. BSW8 TaxID=2259645 RepID=UPI000DE3593E|nr:N4-gp56 family major capsid protein [Rhodovulum sp. BSW8]RBO54656.1 N4-gp56 family major capsid protein [Rhodovulum sp. BSW8]